MMTGGTNKRTFKIKMINLVLGFKNYINKKMKGKFIMKTIIYFIFLPLIILFILTSDTKSQWFQTFGVPAGGGITDMLVSRSSRIVVTTSSFNYPNGQPGGIRSSTNQGFTWITHLNLYTARTLALGVVGSNTVYASAWNFPTTNEGLYVSQSDGASWIGPVYTVGTNDNIFSILVTGSLTVFIGTRNGVHKSTTGGANFTAVNNGIPPNSWVWDLDVDHDNNIAAATTNGLFISTNLGASWQQTTGIPLSDTITSIVFVPPDTTDNVEDGKLVAGSDDGNIFSAEYNTLYLAMVVSAILGTNEWIEACGFTKASQVLFVLHCVSFPKDSNQPGGGVFQSTDRGQTFTQINQGLPNNPAGSSIVGIPGAGAASSELFAGLNNNTMNGATVFRRTITIGIQPISSEIPEKFSLSQNYPNPFNPVTKIRFDIRSNIKGQTSNVKLIVFNSLGREIISLVNERLRAGTYEVEFDGTNFTSGVYFYKLEIENFSETKKMTLVK